MSIFDHFILGEPDDIYHATGLVGSTALKVYAKKGLQALVDYKDGLGRTDNPVFNFGRDFHSRVLEPHAYDQTRIVTPDGLDRRTKAGKDWYKDASDAGKIIVSHKDAELANVMIERMPVEVVEMFTHGQPEVTARSGLFQARIDWLREDGMRVDLKTIDDVDNIERSFGKYQYYMQDGLYGEVCRRVDPSREYRKTVFVFAEKSPPYRWRIVYPDPMYIAIGEEQALDAMTNIENNVANDGDITMLLQPPAWMSGEDY